MEHRTIEVKLLCAKDLKNVNVFSKMDVYVTGSVSGDPRSIQRSPIDRDGGTNPKWNHDMKFTFEESAAMMNRLGLIFQIMSDRTLGDKEIGRVYVPLKELFDASNGGDQSSGEDVNEERQMVYQVQTPTAKFKGQLEFSFKFGQKFTQTIEPKLEEPVIAYPAAGPNPGVAFGGATSTPSPTPKHGPTQYDAGGAVTTYSQGARLSQPSPGYMNMPPNYGSGFGYGCGFGYTSQHMPPPTPNPYMGYSYGYSGGYEYPGQPPTNYVQQLPAQKPKKNKLGLGAAAGIGAGLLGGLLVGDMMEDVAETITYDDMIDF